MHILKEEIFELRHHKLEFTLQGLFKGSGFASTSESEENSVFGKIYTLSKVNCMRMHYFEASLFLNKYRRVKKSVDHRNFYFYQTTQAQEGLLPTKKYLASLLSCYEQYAPEAQVFIEKLKNWPTLEKEIPADGIHLFVPNYQLFGKPLEPILRWYDNLCVKIFLNLIWKPGFFRRKNS